MYSVSQFWGYTLFNSFSFLMLGGIFEKIAKNSYLKTHLKSIPGNEKKLYIANFISLIHAVIISLEGILCIVYPYRNPRTFIPIMSGYFLLDTIVQNKIKSLSTFHHLAGFLLCYFTSVSKELYFFSLLPYFMLSEISTIFLCFGTLIDGTRKSPVVYKNEILKKRITDLSFNTFAVTFFMTRIILLPYKVFHMYKYHSEELKEFGGLYSEVAIFFLLFLQVYWYRLIVKIVLKNLKFVQFDIKFFYQ